MTLEKTLRQQLNKPEPGGFHVSFGGWAVTLLADKQRQLELRAHRIDARPRPRRSQEDLDAWAKRLAPNRERLDGAVAHDRSGPLARQGGPPQRRRRRCWTARRSTTNCCSNARRAARPTCAAMPANGRNGERETVPFVLTHDAVVKLANDIVGKN